MHPADRRCNCPGPAGAAILADMEAHPAYAPAVPSTVGDLHAANDARKLRLRPAPITPADDAGTSRNAWAAPSGCAAG